MDEPHADYKMNIPLLESELLLESIKNQVSESKYPQMYGIGKGGSIVTHPEVDEDSVYFGAADGFLYCLDFNGKEKWRFQSGDVVSSLIVKDEKVYFGSFDSNSYCLDKLGSLIWKINCKSPLGGMPAVYGNSVYIGTKDGLVYSIDLDGKVNWTFQAPESVASNIEADDKAVYFNCYNNCLYSVLHDGRLNWKTHLNSIPSAPTIYKEIIYCGDFDNNFHAISLKGEVLWTVNIEAPLGGQSPRFPIIDDVAYFGNWNGDVFALDIEKRKVLWKFKTGDMIFSKPAVVNGIVYIGSTNGNFYSLDAKTGSLLWKTNVGSPIINTVVYKEGNFFFGTWYGKFLCVSDKGEIKWSFQTSIKEPSSVYVEKKFELKRLLQEAEIGPAPNKVNYSSITQKTENAEGAYGSFSLSYTEKSRDYSGRDINLSGDRRKKYR